MNRPALIMITGLCAGATLLAACSGSGGGSSSPAAATGGGGEAHAADGSVNRVAAAAAPSKAPSAPLGASGGIDGGTGVDVKAVLAPDLILNASITVSIARSVASAADRAEGIAAAAGGRTDSDDRNTVQSRHARPTADLTLRVPNSQVASVLDRVAALGRERTRQLGTRDVTAEVVDVASRVLSARRAIASLNKLYHRAGRVRDVISIETSLAQREAALESLEARQRALQGQTALATITVSLIGRLLPAPTVAHHHSAGGFVGGLHHGWHAFSASVLAVATAVGAVLPFVALFAALGALALVLRRRIHAAPQPTPDAEG